MGAVGSLDLSLSGKVGIRAVAYYLVTTVIAVILGIILVVTIHPGVGGQEKGNRKINSRDVTTPDTLMDLLRQSVPPNIIQATMQQYRTELVNPCKGKNPCEAYYDEDNQWRDPSDPLTWKFKGGWTGGSNILGLITFAIVLGVSLAKLGERGKPLLDFFTSLSEAMMTITTWVISLAPVGVFFLIGGQVLGTQDFGLVLEQLGWYFSTVIIGLVIHGFIVLPALFTLVTRTLPFKFVANMVQAFTTAFGTGSSSATLPVPIGATINMDGTALYEAIAAIFIAQVNNLNPSIGQIFAISITATAASIGAAGIPQAGLVTMVMVLETVGLPPDDITIILAVDWLLDRCRTTINVIGDSIGAGIVNHMCKDELEKMEDDNMLGNAEENLPLTEKDNGELKA